MRRVDVSLYEDLESAVHRDDAELVAEGGVVGDVRRSKIDVLGVTFDVGEKALLFFLGEREGRRGGVLESSLVDFVELIGQSVLDQFTDVDHAPTVRLRSSLMSALPRLPTPNWMFTAS